MTDFSSLSDREKWAQHIRKWATDPPRDGFVERLKQMSDFELECFIFDFAGYNQAESNLASAELIGRGLSVDKYRWE